MRRFLLSLSLSIPLALFLYALPATAALNDTDIASCTLSDGTVVTLQVADCRTHGGTPSAFSAGQSGGSCPNGTFANGVCVGNAANGLPAGTTAGGNILNGTGAGGSVAPSPGAGGINLTFLEGYKNGVLGFINTILAPVLISIAFIFFLYSVYRYFIYGASEPKDRETGRIFVLYAVIGFAVIFSLWGLVNLVTDTFDFGTGGSAASHGLTPPTL